jgi:extracellular factor (EF) 3-hydroxypalmitic acid methyl ester biosynthesis protein
MVKPGGLVIVTNVSDDNPSKAWMEYLVEWNLIYRSRQELEDLIPENVPVRSTRILADVTNVNLFLEIELENG